LFPLVYFELLRPVLETGSLGNDVDFLIVVVAHPELHFLSDNTTVTGVKGLPGFLIGVVGVKAIIIYSVDGSLTGDFDLQL